MTVTNVNEAFAIERADQRVRAEDRNRRMDERVAAGELQRLPGDRYKVLVGWDAGEILSATGEPVHGLDVVDGKAALYSSVPAWHGLGQIIPGGTSDIDEVLALAALDFEVTKARVRYDFEGELREFAERWVTVRTDTGAPLGTVGSRYRIIQNREAFTFLEDLVGMHDVIWESAGSLRGGERTFVSMRLPESIIVDRGGLDDEIQLFLAVMNSHTGRGSSECVLSPWRPVCRNTERFALRDARARWGVRHTSGALERIHEARQTLGLTMAYAKEFEAEETVLARTDIAIAELRAVMDQVWKPTSDGKRALTLAAQRNEAVEAIFRRESERVGRTAYAAERAITDYLDHVAPSRPGKTMTEEIARSTALMEGRHDEQKNTAHRELMKLVRR